MSGNFKVNSKMVIILESEQDLSTAISLKLRVKKPNKLSAVEYTATLYDIPGSSFSHSGVKATIEAEDVDVSGIWKYDGYADFGDGDHYFGTASDFVEPFFN